MKIDDGWITARNPSKLHHPPAHKSVLHSVSLNNCKVIPTKALWYFMLGHLFHDRISKMSNLYPDIGNDDKVVCDICHFARHKKLPYTLSNFKAASKFELIHFDIWNPLSISSIHGHRYFLIFLDDYIRFVWVILLKSKVEFSTHV